MPDHLDIELNYHLNPRASDGPAVGLLALAEDASIEADLYSFLADLAPDIYTSRVRCEATINADTLAAMGERLEEAMQTLVPSTEVDVVAYGCTSGSMVLGQEALEIAVHQFRPGVAVTNPLLAARRWMQANGVKRPAILVPYVQPLAMQVGEALVADSDRELAALGTFNCDQDPLVVRIDPRSIVHGVKNLITGIDADGVFISCTALRLNGIVDELSAGLSLPVSGSNHALSVDIRRLCQEAAESSGNSV